MADRIWRRFSSSEGASQSFECGPLKVFLQWRANEIWIAFKRGEPSLEGDGEGSEVLAWSRWALSDDDTGIEVVPVLPSLPILLKPEDPYRFVMGARARIYTRIPLWIQLRTEKARALLTEIPTQTMSSTWFGSTIDGERCLSHHSSVRRFISDDFFQPHLAICTLDVRNASTGELKFDRICLRTDNMTLYELGDHLWTDVTHITYKGAGSDGEVEMSAVAPVEAGGASLISRPRVGRSSNLVVRTFELFRDIRN